MIGRRQGRGPENGAVAAGWIRAAARYARPLGGSKVDVFVPAIRELRTVFPDMPASVTAERVGWQFSASALRARSPSQGCCTARVIRQTHEQLRSGCPGQLAGSVGPGTSTSGPLVTTTRWTRAWSAGSSMSVLSEGDRRRDDCHHHLRHWVTDSIYHVST